MKYDMHRKSSRRTGNSRLKIYGLSLAVMAVLVFRVCLSVAVMNTENRVRDIRSEKERIQKEITDLELEVTRLSAGSRIKRIAQDELGLVIPDGAPESLY